MVEDLSPAVTTGAPWRTGSSASAWGACTRCTNPTSVYFRIYLMAMGSLWAWCKNPRRRSASSGRGRKSDRDWCWAARGTGCGCITARLIPCSLTPRPSTTPTPGPPSSSEWTRGIPWIFSVTIWPVFSVPCCRGEVVWMVRMILPPSGSASPKVGAPRIIDNSSRRVQHGWKCYSTSTGDITPRLMPHQLPYILLFMNIHKNHLNEYSWIMLLNIHDFCYFWMFIDHVIEYS